MSSLCPSALAVLDDSLALAYESLRKLEAAESVDLMEVIRRFEDAESAARKVRAVMSSEHPRASWGNRDELEALIAGGRHTPERRETTWGLRFLRWARAR
ncbi:MAG TPA: hypothetical protein VMD98_10890 [Bryocella sp.]|nr:hypothetical protein [Bryocella sp.]